MRSSIFVILACVSALPFASTLPSENKSGVVCEGQVTESQRFIGKDRNVKLEIVTCPEVTPLKREVLEARQTNLCATTCNTNCFLPAGGGPDPNQCHIIADALRFESQNTGAIFPVGTGTNNTVVMTFQSCLSFFVNQDTGPVDFCRTNWADTLDNLAFNCQATQNAHGGNCVATDQTYFIQVQSA